MLKITVTGWTAMTGISRRGSVCSSEVKSSWRIWGPWIWSWGQAHDVLKLAEGRGRMMFRKWLRVMDLMKVASRCLRSFTRMRQDKTQDKTRQDTRQGKPSQAKPSQAKKKRDETRRDKTRQGIRKGLILMLAYYREVLKENNCYSSRQISVLISVKSYSGTHT